MRNNKSSLPGLNNRANGIQGKRKRERERERKHRAGSEKVVNLIYSIVGTVTVLNLVFSKTQVYYSSDKYILNSTA